MFGQPWYRGYPSNISYNPYLHSSYQTPRAPYPYAFDEDRARAIADQRARRAQYLPDEVDDDEDDYWSPAQFGPRERAYLEARKRQEMLERMKQEEEEAAQQRALEEQRWQKALEERQREDQEKRQKLLEERRRQMRLKREEEERRIAAERDKVYTDSLLPDAADSNKNSQQRQQQQMHARRDRSRSNASQRQPARDTQRQRSQSPAQQDTSSMPIPIHVHNQSTSSPAPSSSSKSSIPVPETDATSRPSSPRTPPARTPSPISRHSIEEQNEAASRIQRQYRIHASLRSLDDLASQFETLKKNFVYPRSIDFQNPGSEGGHISVGAYRPPSDFDNEDEVQPMDVDGPEGKLDYTSTNYALHSYVDSMDKLLMKLDGVESWGQKEIRQKRRDIVKSIEKEASKIERYWKQTWIDYLVKQASKSKPSESQQSEEHHATIPITSPSSEDSAEPMEDSEED
ncbi:hypothetical protein JR316_0010907 [Psilocybe cubensis]|uniref:BAG domain-containing protein n=2 Tax=Psilocybe cubensis TaxID=181762 RepID=A0A8H8CFX5_PSICU|nr:hypothetical protein JR316_0010907 [Psilocybe cubensis]KAH9476991.1 hypothetical protein JR316_0010907 [Psilocybe cubensis]